MVTEEEEEEDIAYWMEILPPNTPEENRIINYYRKRWARLAQREEAEGQQALASPQLPAKGVSEADDEAESQATGNSINHARTGQSSIATASIVRLW